MNYTELQKLFPKIKIPDIKEAEYYLNVLDAGDDIPFGLLEDFEQYTKDVAAQGYKSIENYKMKKLDELVAYLKTDWDVSQTFESPKDYTIKEFGDFKTDKMYVSIDLSSANYTAWRAIMQKNPGFWDDFAESLGVHRFLAGSKSFRQYVFGNTHPRRLEAKQKEIMLEFMNFLPEELRSHIVARRNDELIFEMPLKDFTAEPFNNVMRAWYLEQKEKVVPYNMHMDLFSMSFEQNAGERVAIKQSYVWDKNLQRGPLMAMGRSLFQVEGNRHFIHYKKLILGEPIDPRDLIFKSGKHYAQWVL